MAQKLVKMLRGVSVEVQTTLGDIFGAVFKPQGAGARQLAGHFADVVAGFQQVAQLAANEGVVVKVEYGGLYVEIFAGYDKSKQPTF